jgi:tape measure domain-containing protein
MADILASVSVVLGAEVSGFKAAMADARKELKGLVQFSEGLRDVGSNLTRAVSVPIALLGVGAVAASAKLESLKNGLQAIAQQELGKQGVTGLVGVQQAAQQTGERLKELQVIAKAPGLGLETAEQADIRLRAVGTSAAESAKEIKAFANAIATTGGGRTEFQTVTTQIAQMTAKGKVLAQDLRPIIEAAPAVAAALQTLYGTVDSEDISKKLAKQGQSSKDFVRILTEELSKLPQVTGGLKAIYENDMDALLVASAKVGDGIAKSLNLQAVGEKLGNTITAIGDGFANLSAPTQAAIVTFAGLAAAAGPVLLGLGTIGAALPAIKAGFVAVQGAAALMTASLEAGFLALLNPVTIVVAALAAFAIAAYRIETASERALDSFREQSAATRKLATDISPLLDRYDELKSKTTLTANEQAELKAIVEKVTAAMPAAGQGIDNYGNYIGLATDKARDFIKANQGLEKAIAIQSLPAQQQKLQDLTEAYDRLLKERDQLNRGSFNGIKVEDLGTQFLVDFQKELGDSAVALEKQKRLVAELGGAAGVTATEFDALAATLPGLAANLAKLGTPFPIAGFGAGDAGAIAAQVGLLKRLHDQLTQLKEDQQNAGTEKQALAFNPQIKSLQEYIARLEGADKISKKVADAIKKLREELARLTALDNLLGNTPTELQVLERRADTLVKGLKTLVDSGVSPASKAFQGFEQDMVKTSQAADKLLAGIGKNMPDGEQLELKAVSVKSLIPQNIGDTLPEDVARSLGDYAKKAIPFELPVAAKINMQNIAEALQPVRLLSKEMLALNGLSIKPDWDGFVPKDLKAEIDSLGKSFREISDAAQVFGGSFDAAGAKAAKLQESIQNLIANGHRPQSEEIQKLTKEYNDNARESALNRAETSAMQAALGSLSSAAENVGAAIAAGGDTTQALLAGLLDTVSSFMAEYGKQLVLIGAGDIAIGNVGKGIAEIGAGLALSLGAGVAKGAGAASANANAAKPASPTPTNYGQTTSAQTIKVIAEFRLRGQDLAAVGRSQTFRSKVTD